MQIFWDIDSEAAFWTNWVLLHADLLPASPAGESGAVVALADSDRLLLDSILAKDEIRDWEFLAHRANELFGLITYIGIFAFQIDHH